MKTLAFPSLLLLALVSLSATAPAQVDTDRTVATINGEEIKGGEYYHRMEYLGGVGKQLGQVYSELPPGLLTLDALITEKLVYQLAREKGVYPSDLEVTKELEVRTTKDPTYLGRWKESGKSDADLRGEVRYELTQYKLQTYGITIADGEIDAYYAAQPARFTTPKRLKLRVITVQTDEEKAAVDKDLSSGIPFAKVADTRSIDSSRGRGGEYGAVPIDTLVPSMKTALGALKKGQVSAWIQTGEGERQVWIKFLLDDILPETKQKLDADVRREVRRYLALQRGSVKNDIRKDLMETRRKAKIDITSPEFADAYRKFIAQYLGVASTAAAPATPPATAPAPVAPAPKS